MSFPTGEMTNKGCHAELAEALWAGPSLTLRRAQGDSPF